MAPPLAGLQVLDLSSGVAGAVTTMLLADHGAEVVKIEPPGGDPFRGAPGSIVWNRGKQSVVLDLESADEREKVFLLSDRADVVVDTFSPSTADCLGIASETLCARNQRLIGCSITGYGRTGEARDRPACDALVQARSGLQYEQPGLRDGPIFLHAPLPSLGAALLAVVGIGAALHAREITGEGQLVETSLMQGSLVWTTQIWKRAARPTEPLLALWRFKDVGPTPCFEGSDGQWFHPMPNGLPLALAHLGRDPSELENSGTLLGEPAERARYFASLRELFRQRPRDEWVELFQRNDIPCQPIQPAEAAFDHPQLLHTGGVVTIDVLGAGPVAQVGHAYHLELHDDRVPGPPPAVGEHTASVLARLADEPPLVSAPSGRALRHALEGVRVLDLGTVVAGPFGGMILADLGADVIKVEPMSAAVGTPGDATWVSSNRGKRCIAVDLKTAEGREILDRLIATADVIHYNLRTGVAERLGFDHQRVKAINRRIVFSHLTAYGNTGPLARWPGSDQMAQALCGLEYEQGASPAGGHPTWYRFGMTDAAAGLLSVVGILQALYHRERTGVGQAVDTDILRAGMLLASNAFVGPDGLRRRPRLDRWQTGFGPWYRLYECAVGWICVAACTRRQRDDLIRVVGIDAAATDTDVAAQLEAAFRTRDAAEWRRDLDTAGVACEIARERTDDWCDDPDALANGWIAAYEHPVWGRLEQPGTFVHLSGTPGRTDVAPPMIGQHTDEVLYELGYAPDEVEAWREQGVIGG